MLLLSSILIIEYVV